MRDRVVVRKEVERAKPHVRGAIPVCPRNFIASHIFVNLLGDGGVITDDNKARRGVSQLKLSVSFWKRVSASGEILLVVRIELLESELQGVGKDGRLLDKSFAFLFGASALFAHASLWEIIFDVVVEI